MAPVKFGLFKARSREQEQPSTENLLHSSQSSDNVAAPGSPVPSTSYAKSEQLCPADITALQLDSDDEDFISDQYTPITQVQESVSQNEDPNVNYNQFRNQSSTDATSTSTLNEEDFDQDSFYAEDEDDPTLAIDPDDSASTTCDVNSLQFDETSLAASEDLSIYCGTLKKGKKTKSKEQLQQLRDFDMWQASNLEVMQHILSRTGTLDDQIKWEAIATARGLCTLTDNCTCSDCKGARYLVGVSDGDAGLGSAPLFSAMVGCCLQ